MNQPISYQEMTEKVKKINQRDYDYEQPFFDLVDQLLDESEGKHVHNFLTDAFERLLAQVNKEIELVEDELGLTPTCGVGCAHCCYFPIIVTRLEAKLMLLFINQLPEARKQRIFLQISEYHDKFSSEINVIKKFDFKKDDSFKLKYKQLGLPCMFLDEETNRCIAYEVRPIPCRTYLNYTNASVCSEEHLPKEPVSFEFLHRFYVQGMDEIIQEILEVVSDQSLGFSYPNDAAEVNYLPILIEEELNKKSLK
ncbi:YkgJ family cysteine cluster protein [Halalkalibacter krulwichiae]|uniref:Flagellin N-methylase n=1 Tax=Halalkalibacter krulwichiae TaxID=199441 RepID=A0A1X9M6A2_9BACI|nr:YkgJ family cysteine cluster protein [Halalkalibacter krulwichiae]ARK28975.1 Flagellin N-methylase [Halalkalibacter krulwichiae]